MPPFFLIKFHESHISIDYFEVPLNWYRLILRCNMVKLIISNIITATLVISYFHLTSPEEKKEVPTPVSENSFETKVSKKPEPIDPTNEQEKLPQNEDMATCSNDQLGEVNESWDDYILSSSIEYSEERSKLYQDYLREIYKIVKKYHPHNTEEKLLSYKKLRRTFKNVAYRLDSERRTNEEIEYERDSIAKMHIMKEIDQKLEAGIITRLKYDQITAELNAIKDETQAQITYRERLQHEEAKYRTHVLKTFGPEAFRDMVTFTQKNNQNLYDQYGKSTYKTTWDSKNHVHLDYEIEVESSSPKYQFEI